MAFFLFREYASSIALNLLTSPLTHHERFSGNSTFALDSSTLEKGSAALGMGGDHRGRDECITCHRAVCGMSLLGTLLGTLIESIVTGIFTLAWKLIRGTFRLLWLIVSAPFRFTWKMIQRRKKTDAPSLKPARE
ncbi:MAG: hypothetical protein OXC70_06210 [Gammaproteobacteria bacterium]|nr:hypothetical protein [Gammaproteobacteria bacterium]